MMVSCRAHCDVLCKKRVCSALERQDFSCTYLAHHELESVLNIIIIIIIIMEKALAPAMQS